MSRRSWEPRSTILASLLAGAAAGSAATLLLLLTFGKIGPQTPSDSSSTAQSPSTESSPSTSANDSQTPSTAPETTLKVSRDIFVDPNGIDESGRGREEGSPVQTPDFAIGMAVEGDTVHFASGTYPSLTINEKAGLTVVGAPNSSTIFTAEGYGTRSGVLINSSDQISLQGIQIENSLWGLLVLASSDVLLADSTIINIGQEGILVSDNSTRIEIAGNTISETGRRPGTNGTTAFANFGEGIYLGTGGVLDDGSYDQTSDISIHDNEISFTTAEAIDVKPSVSHVVISDNLVHDIATANSGAIVVSIGERSSPSPDVVIERNVIYAISRTSPWRDGNAIVLSAPAIVRNNLIWDVQHHGILLDRNLRSETAGQILIEGNVVFQTGLEPISDSSELVDSLISIAISNNHVDDAAVVLVQPFQGETVEDFSQAVFDLLLKPSG